MTQIPQHSHCKICGKAIPTDETFCSKDCEERFQAMTKKRKILIYVMYALMFFVIAVLAANIF